MRILVVGGGGREHALAWRCAQSPDAEVVYVAPGNAGTAAEGKIQNVPITADATDELIRFVRDNEVALTIVGPEAPLVAGIADRFAEAGLRCFGPSAAAARLEGSKAYTKDFLARHDIPSGRYGSFGAVEPALAFIREQGAPIVVKADGLAAGKGVVVARTEAEAESAVREMLEQGSFGEAGARVVIEEFLEGEEASFIVMVDGERILPLVSSQDHKARDEGDRGPNTGGMGAYCPAPVITPALHERVMAEIMRPTVAALADAGTPYTGFLYAGLMIGADGDPRVLEFNCRLGDPETQPIMMRMRSDLPGLCLAALEGRLDEAELEWDERAALGVVLAAEGYPGSYRKGDPVSGLEELESLPDLKVFHAGTRLDDEGRVVTAGGRVLCVVGLGDSVGSARDRAYAGVDALSWKGMFCRRDIGHRAISREGEG